MSIMRKTGSERWTIVEGEGFSTLRELDRGFEGVDFFPEGEDALLLLGEVDGCHGGMPAPPSVLSVEG